MTRDMAEVAEHLATPYWLADAIKAAAKRDPLDAYRDAQELARLLRLQLVGLGLVGQRA